MLEEPVTWQHIKAAHPLRTRKNLSHVVIVRFNHRGICDDILDNKRHLKNHPSQVSVTEHLTDLNRKLVNDARDILGNNKVWTRAGRVFGIVGTKKIPIMSIPELE